MMLSNLNRRNKRLVAAVTLCGVAVVGGGIAYAYWTSTGSGSGSGTTGASVPFVVASSAATGGPLTPGGPDQSVAFTVTNPSTGSQYLTNVVVTVANADGSPWTAVAGCSAADYTVDAPVITYGQIAPSGVASGTVALRMNNLAENQDACQNATVPLYFAAS